MCGGLARWLRLIGYDTFYREGVADQELIDIARTQNRVVITSDGKLLERRLFTTGRLQAVDLPRGLKLLEQVEYVARALHLTVGTARCTRCNGELVPVSRAEVGDEVPARSLIWAKKFFRCADCGHVFWEGTHWRHIAAVRERIANLQWDEPR